MLRKVKNSLQIDVQVSVRKGDTILSSLSGIILSLPFHTPRFWMLAWLGFVPLFFALKDKSSKKAFFLGYIAGIFFWVSTIFWLTHVTLLGLILLVLYLALYFGFFGLMFSFSQPYSANSEPSITNPGILFIPTSWVLLEYIRSHLFTGFPWALLGYTQHSNLTIIQIADITGVWGVSFLVVMINLTIYSILASHSSLRVKLKKEFIAILIFLIIISYGQCRLRQTNNRFADASPGQPSEVILRVSVVQPNISQELKWLPQTAGYILEKCFMLTEQAMKDSPDLVIWPEAALPGILGEDKLIGERISSFSRQIKIPLLIGSVVYENGKYFNSAILLKEGKIIDRYDKLHLVPFGEYIPLKFFFPFLETIVPIGDISPGKEFTLLTHKSQRFAVLICFEDLFPELSRRFAKRGARFLINITNDAWYKKTSASFQHLQASVFRAVENRLFLVRAANTGISGFISPVGETFSLVSDESKRIIFVEGYQTQRVIIEHRGNPTLYTRFGDIFILLLFIFSSICAIRYVK